MPNSELRRVRGADLIRIAGCHDPRPAPVTIREQAWRFIEPEPFALAVDEGERFLLATRMHWCVPAKMAAKAVALTPPAMIAMMVLGVWVPGLWPLQLALGFYTIWHILRSGYDVLGHYAKVLVVTSRRMVVTSGLVNCELQDVMLDSIQHFEVKRPILGRMLGYGHIRIETAGVHDDGARRELNLFVDDPTFIYNACRTRVVA